MKPGLASIAVSAALVVAACATPPRSPVLDESATVAASEPVEHAKKWAPQAYARAEQLREKANQAQEDGATDEAEALAGHAIAAYQRALVLARLAQAEDRIATANAQLAELKEQRDLLDTAQRAVAAQVQRLELRYKVARDAEPLEPVEKADPKREVARRVAARSIIETAQLLCLAAEIIDPHGGDQSPKDIAKLREQLSKLEQSLEGSLAPTPIDEAYRLRSGCLRALTQRRQKTQAGDPAADPADVLLSQLSNALPEHPPFRDDRGVGVALLSPFDARGGLTQQARATLDQLAQIAQANSEFKSMLVIHGKGDRARVDSVKRWLQNHEHLADAALHDAGTKLPAAVGAVAGAKPHTGRLEFVFVPR
jgi:hypothetical protein